MKMQQPRGNNFYTGRGSEIGFAVGVTSGIREAHKQIVAKSRRCAEGFQDIFCVIVDTAVAMTAS
jgi:hypothetical protein